MLASVTGFDRLSRDDQCRKVAHLSQMCNFSSELTQVLTDHPALSLTLTSNKQAPWHCCEVQLRGITIIIGHMYQRNLRLAYAMAVFLNYLVQSQVVPSPTF